MLSAHKLNISKVNNYYFTIVTGTQEYPRKGSPQVVCPRNPKCMLSLECFLNALNPKSFLRVVVLRVITSFLYERTLKFKGRFLAGACNCKRSFCIEY